MRINSRGSGEWDRKGGGGRGGEREKGGGGGEGRTKEKREREKQKYRYLSADLLVSILNGEYPFVNGVPEKL